MVDEPGDNTLSAALDTLFAPYNRSDRPGVAVGVAQNGRILYRRGFGLANLDAGTVNAPNTPMRIGSTSKQFTALALMLLAEQGKLRIDDDVRLYLPELPEFDPPPTLRHLLNHTSGLRDYMDTSFLSNGLAPLPEAENLRYTLAARTKNFTTGERSLYCNGGYYLLALVVEKVSGTSIENFLRRQIFEPIGMFDSVLWRDDRKILPGQASLHLVSASGEASRFIFPASIPGEGGIISTVDDMLRWLAHMRRPLVGSEATWREMTSPCLYNNGTEGIYGFGLVRQQHRGLETVGHPGGVVGGRSEVLTVPAHKLDVVVIVNRSDVNAPQLARHVIDRVLEGQGLGAQRSPDEDAERLAGHWFAPGAQQYFQLVVGEGRLSVNMGGGPESLERGTDGSLRLARPNIGVLEFRPHPADQDGVVSGVEFVHCGNAEPAHRVPAPAEAPISAAEALRGSYWSEEGAAHAVVEATDSAATLTLIGRYGRTQHALHPLGPNAWLAKPKTTPVNPWMVVTIHGAGLDISTTRTWKLRFTRLPQEDVRAT